MRYTKRIAVFLLAFIAVIGLWAALGAVIQGADPDEPCTITITKKDPWIRFIKNTHGPSMARIPRPKATLSLQFDVLGDSTWQKSADWWNPDSTSAVPDTTSGRWHPEDVGVTIENCFFFYEGRP